MNEERDLVVAELLDRAARELVPEDRLGSVLRYGSRRRWKAWTGVTLALVLFLGAVGWAALVVGRGPRMDRSGWQTYSGPRTGWSLEYPPEWRVQVISETCETGGYRGAVAVTSVDFVFRNPDGRTDDCFGRWVLAGFPADGVAVLVHPAGIRPGLFGREPDTEFPLSFHDLTGTSGIRGGPREYYLPIWIAGEEVYFLRAWIGTGASEGDVAALRGLVASVTFDLRYPRGAFEWCPSLHDVSVFGPQPRRQATAAAEEFVEALRDGDEKRLAEVVDASAPVGLSPWAGVSTTAGWKARSRGPASGDGLVVFGCGRAVATSTWRVLLDDGTPSASLDTTLYLVQRPEGWKVWGAY